MKERKLPLITQSNIVAESRLFRLEQIDLEFTNGETRQYERVRGTRPRGAVMIVPMLDDNTIILVREYAAGTHQYELGFPKGLIEENEAIIDAANREMQEEVGYAARDLTQLKTMSIAPGYMRGRMFLVLACDLYPNKLIGDEPEEIEVVTWKLDNIEELLRRPDFSEARSIAALCMLKSGLLIEETGDNNV